LNLISKEKSLNNEKIELVIGIINVLQRLIPAILEKPEQSSKFFWSISEVSKKCQAEILLESIISLFFKENFTIKSNIDSIY